MTPDPKFAAAVAKMSSGTIRVRSAEGMGFSRSKSGATAAKALAQDVSARAVRIQRAQRAK
jgi:hypothetical protein